MATKIFKKFIPEIISTRRFKDKFFECLQRHPVSLYIASPYIGELPNFGTIIKFSQYFLREEGITFTLITAPPIQERYKRYLSISDADILVKLGVDLIIRKKPYLHSKIYQFTFKQNDQASFIGSANFTKGGLLRNDETMAMFRDPQVNKKIRDELNRLSSYGSYLYNKWKYDNALEKKGVRNV